MKEGTKLFKRMEAFKNTSFVAALDKLDKRLSSYIHHLELPWLMQLYVLFFAIICNKEGPFLLLVLVSYVLPQWETTPVRPYYGIYYGMQYFAQGMTCFVFIVMIKKFFRRPRPSVKNAPYRIKNLRGLEIDCSWPSGDTGQASCFAFYLLSNMPVIVSKVPCG